MFDWNDTVFRWRNVTRRRISNTVLRGIEGEKRTHPRFADWGSCKLNYHTTTTVEVQLRWKVIVLLIFMEFMIIIVYKLFFSYQSMKIIGLLKVCFFVGWNLYLMWSSVNCRHNVRHIRTIPFLLPPDWDGWPLNFTITHFIQVYPCWI